MSLAPSPCTRSPSIRPGRLSCAGTVSRWPASSSGAPASPGEHAGVAEVAHRYAAVAQHGCDVGGEPLLVARLRRDVDQLERPCGEPLGRGPRRPHNSLLRRALLRRRHLRQARQPAARDAARAARARGRRRARRDVLRARARSSRSRARSRASAAARPSSRSTRRPARGSTCSPPARRCAPSSACRRAATSACASATRCCSGAACRSTRCRPPARRRSGWEQWIGVGFELFAALAELGFYRPQAANGRIEPVGSAALRFGRRLRDLSRRDLLRAARPPAVAEAHAVGPAAADRGAAQARASTTPTAGSGTARSTSSTPAPPPTPRTRSPPGSASGSGRRRRA